MGTIESRAADYFGMAREPRHSLKTGRRSCVVVARRGGGTVLASYNEDFKPTGEYIWLTDKQRDQLVAALQPERKDR